MRTIAAVAALLFFLGSPAYSADPPWGVANGHNGSWNPAWNNGEYHGPYQNVQGYEGHPTLFGGYEEKFWVGDCRIEPNGSRRVRSDSRPRIATRIADVNRRLSEREREPSVRLGVVRRDTQRSGEPFDSASDCRRRALR